MFEIGQGVTPTHFSNIEGDTDIGHSGCTLLRGIARKVYSPHRPETMAYDYSFSLSAIQFHSCVWEAYLSSLRAVAVKALPYSLEPGWRVRRHGMTRTPLGLFASHLRRLPLGGPTGSF